MPPALQVYSSVVPIVPVVLLLWSTWVFDGARHIEIRTKPELGSATDVAHLVPKLRIITDAELLLLLLLLLHRSLLLLLHHAIHIIEHTIALPKETMIHLNPLRENIRPLHDGDTVAVTVLAH
jgi:hypothetical protein